MQYLEKLINSSGISCLNEITPIKKLNALTKIRSEFITIFALLLVTLFLVLTNFGQFILSTLLIYLYPVYKTFKALDGKNDTEVHRWLVYWTVFGFFFSIIEMVSLFVQIPSLRLIMTVFFFSVYCALIDGQAYLYDNMMKPLLT